MDEVEPVELQVIASARAWPRRPPYYILVGIAVLVLGVGLGLSVRSGAELRARTAIQASAAAEIILQMTEAHLWLEEILSGDREEDVTAVLNRNERDLRLAAVEEDACRELLFPLGSCSPIFSEVTLQACARSIGRRAHLVQCQMEGLLELDTDQCLGLGTAK